MFGQFILLDILVGALIFFAGGATAALFLWRSVDACRRTSHVLALAGSILLLLLGIGGVSGYGGALEFVVPGILPLVGGLALGLDRLSAFFLLIIAAGSIPCALYAIGYTAHYKDKQPAMALALNVFIPAMCLVLVARNVATFLVFWEVMSLASYFLVMTNNDDKETQRAGWLYFVMTHAGLACLLIGFLYISQASGSLVMTDWARLAGGIDPRARSIAFVVLAAGFLSKAGAIPFHVWLPRAHPAAPSHISALMSGVMIKLGLYGLIRIGFEWLGKGPAWWGVVILAIGALSAVIGVLYAIVDSDLKRLLAYSSVENIGVILLGVGASLIFHSFSLDSLSALALLAVLYHSLNHAAFKGLLFLCAGAVVHATGTRNMESMGGLLRRMPQTGAMFLLGSLAISAMPPFNGFVSEWLIFQSLLLSFRISDQFYNLVLAVSIAALALTAGLAVACFVRAFGITFLALPRSSIVERAHEPQWSMRAAMLLLGAACVLLGVMPVAVLRPLSGVVQEFTGSAPDLEFNVNTILTGTDFGVVSPLSVTLVLCASVFATWLALRIGGANFRRRAYETWGCGRAVQSSRFEYTAKAFANPFKRVFAFLYRPVDETDIESHPESRLFVKAITYRSESRSIVEEYIYSPVIGTIRRLSARAAALQSGNVHSYLLYMLLALIVLLMWAR